MIIMKEIDEHHKVTRELIEMSCPVVQEPLIGCTPGLLRSSYLMCPWNPKHCIYKLYVFACSDIASLQPLVANWDLWRRVV